MIKIKYNQKNIKNNYQSLKMDFIFDSIFQGLTPAKIFVSNSSDKCLSIVEEGANYYFGGESDNKDKYLEVIDFFINNLVEKRTHNYYIAKIHYSSDKWKNLLFSKLNKYKLQVVDRCLYQYNLTNTPNQQSCDYAVKAIDKSLLKKELDNKIGLVQELKYMWGSQDNFLNNGFGSCAVKDNTIIGWCTAEYLSDKNCGIGVETIERYQKQGIAYNNTCNLLSMCKNKQLTAYWDCWANNIGSVKTAEKCGFSKLLNYDIIVLQY